MSGVLRVRLSGGDARLGAVPASDVAKLLLGVEAAVARATGHVLGRRVKSTGRWQSAVATSVRFRLVAVEEGSVVTVLELPEMETDPDSFDFDASTLGEMGLVAALKTATGDAADPDVAAALLKMVDQIGLGTRYDAVTFDTDVRDAPPAVTLDVPARERLEQVAAKASPEVRPDTLVGVLVEADFEKFSARLRSPDGRSVAVNFDEELADDIQEVLRSPAKLVGEIEYDPETARAVRVELRAITRAEQLAMYLEPGEFWEDVTIDDLRAQRGVEPVSADVELGDPNLTDEEADAFLAALNS